MSEEEILKIRTEAALDRDQGAEPKPAPRKIYKSGFICGNCGCGLHDIVDQWCWNCGYRLLWGSPACLTGTESEKREGMNSDKCPYYVTDCGLSYCSRKSQAFGKICVCTEEDCPLEDEPERVKE